MQEDIGGTGRSSAAPQLDDETYELVQELFRIVRAGEAVRVAGLLRKGLVPNLCDGKGDSLLMLAAYHGHTELVDVLLRYAADTELANDRGQTPLAAAAFKGYVDIVRLLLESGANVNARMPNGQTALTTAAMFDRAEMVKLLLAYGADPSLVDENGMTAQSAAQKMGAWAAVEHLEASANRSNA